MRVLQLARHARRRKQLLGHGRRLTRGVRLIGGHAHRIGQMRRVLPSGDAGIFATHTCAQRRPAGILPPGVPPRSNSHGTSTDRLPRLHAVHEQRRGRRHAQHRPHSCSLRHGRYERTGQRIHPKLRGVWPQTLAASGGGLPFQATTGRTRTRPAGLAAAVAGTRGTATVSSGAVATSSRSSPLPVPAASGSTSAADAAAARASAWLVPRPAESRGQALVGRLPLD